MQETENDIKIDAIDTIEVCLESLNDLIECYSVDMSEEDYNILYDEFFYADAKTDQCINRLCSKYSTDDFLKDMRSNLLKTSRELSSKFYSLPKPNAIIEKKRKEREEKLKLEKELKNKMEKIKAKFGGVTV